MTGIARLSGLFALLLLLFLAAALGAQQWLQRQHARLQAEAIATKHHQLQAAVAITGGSQSAWTAGRLAEIGRLIDARVSLRTGTDQVRASNEITFESPLPGSKPQTTAIVAFQLPATARLSLLHGRTWIMLLVVALTLMLLIVAAGLYATRRGGSGDTRTPWAEIRADMSSLEQLARTSVAQGTALAQERDSRQRVEQDLSLNQRLLNQALEEKIRLGRDLNDGVIQSLYAVGLTIEAVRSVLTTDPGKADQRLQQCLDGLNGTIRDVRDYITGLAPDKLRRMSFAAAIESLVQELRGGRDIQLELVVDEDAAAALAPEQTTEALQVAREAISNGLRHGQASTLTVRLHRGEAEIGLLIRDNGQGFHPEHSVGRGHGLGNMQARAAQVGATLRIDSQPDEGTRVVVTFPVKPAV